MRRPNRSYAVVWGANGEFGPGRVEAFDDRFELYGKNRRLSIAFAELRGMTIERSQGDRLHGLPVLAVERSGDEPLVRIASLEGTAVLHELFDQVELKGAAPAGADRFASVDGRLRLGRQRHVRDQRRPLAGR